MFDKIGIIGLGLIGGSLAKAFRNRVNVKTIVAFNRNEDVLINAYNEGVIDEYATEINSMFADCDIIFICTPVDKIYSYAEKLSTIIKPTCIITDVGSTKGSLYDSMKNISDKFYFIGGHPMTGSEKFRYNASKEHLFENAYYILTPDESVPADVTLKFKNAIEQIGAISIVVSAYEHDYIVASISHVPHIIAAALCHNVKALDTEDKHMKLLAAGGFKDITRIASSSPEMWESICLDNSTEIVKVLDNLESIISNTKNLLKNSKSSDIYNYFDESRKYRDSFTTITPGAFIKTYEIIVDVQDKPGAIAIIAVLFSSNNINIKNLSIVNSREDHCGVLHISFEKEEERQKSIELLKQMNYEVIIKD